MSTQQTLTTGRLPYARPIARIAWLVVTCITFGLFFAGIPGRYEQLVAAADKRALMGLGLSVSIYAVGIIVLNFIFVLAHHLMAVVIFGRRRDDWMALFVCFALVTNGAMIPLSLMYPP
ncbi:MAG: hypothetical protein DPW09_35480, partial [Anaerolineae bacterium]|nr:hypothetical protein [Anaerolineae bacterium]